MRYLLSVTCIAIIILIGSCATNPAVQDSYHIIDIEHEFEQKEYYPPAEKINYYFEQSVLFAELGARFFNMEEYETAKQYFDLAVMYDQYNNKAHFSIGLLEYADGNVKDALVSFRRVRRQERLFPYDIDYFAAARMILDQFPITPRIISTARNERSVGNGDDRFIIINRGLFHGVVEKMEFTVYRIGHPIRDFETLRELGVERTPIGRVTVVELDDEISVCRVDHVEPGYFLQVNDLLETDY